MIGTKPTLTGGCNAARCVTGWPSRPSKVSICFCRMCQKAVGGYFGAFANSAVADLDWTAGKPSYFASSEAAERGFCAQCGTPLTFAYRDTGRVSVSAGSLDTPEAFPPTFVYGIEGKVEWFDRLCELAGSRTEDDVPVEDMARYRSRQHPDHD